MLLVTRQTMSRKSMSKHNEDNLLLLNYLPARSLSKQLCFKPHLPTVDSVQRQSRLQFRAQRAPHSFPPGFQFWLQAFVARGLQWRILGGEVTSWAARNCWKGSQSEACYFWLVQLITLFVITLLDESRGEILDLLFWIICHEIDLQVLFI